MAGPSGPYDLEGPWPTEGLTTDWYTVYRIYDARRPEPTLLYIGSARFPQDRLDSHRRSQAPFLEYARYWTYQWYTGAAAALAAEKQLIDELDPPFNTAHRRPGEESRRLPFRRPRRGARLQLLDRPYEQADGRPVRASQVQPYRCKPISLRVTAEDWRALELVRAEKGINKNELLRALIRLYKHDPVFRSTVDEVAATLNDGQD